MLRVSFSGLVSKAAPTVIAGDLFQALEEHFRDAEIIGMPGDKEGVMRKKVVHLQMEGAGAVYMVLWLPWLPKEDDSSAYNLIEMLDDPDEQGNEEVLTLYERLVSLGWTPPPAKSKKPLSVGEVKERVSKLLSITFTGLLT